MSLESLIKFVNETNPETPSADDDEVSCVNMRTHELLVRGTAVNLATAVKRHLKADKALKSIMTTKRGSLARVISHLGSRDLAFRFLAIGVHAGVWKLEDAESMMGKTAEQASRMIEKNDFLYVRMLTE